MLHRITVLPVKQNIAAAAGENLLSVLRGAQIVPDAPCGGMGRCGKCKVLVDGKEVLACQTIVDRDMTVTLIEPAAENLLTDGIAVKAAPHLSEGAYLLAFDIGTTTVAGYLSDGKTGAQIAAQSMRNPQIAFGADVISRIQQALHGHMDALTQSIQACMEQITQNLCQNAGILPEQISMVSVVGNPAMQQFFLGIRPDNLAQIPFAPVLTQLEITDAKVYLPLCSHAKLLIVPDIAGFVGADTLSCVLATELYKQKNVTLLVDIGTNAEMVLGNAQRMVACSAAAGPALEGANIRFGMRGQAGAIDHVWLENGQIEVHVIGDGPATGICGSGLIDAVAVALDMGLINERGKILTAEGILPLTKHVYLTQEDIRQVQTAKGAIAAGIGLMAAHLQVCMQDIEQVYLAGAFGTFLNPESACRIGLLPAQWKGRIIAVGNAAGSGARLLAQSVPAQQRAQKLLSQIEFLELAADPGFRRCFAQNMRF